MIIKIAIVAPLIAVIITYIAGFAGNIFLFLNSVLITILTLLFAVFSCTTTLIWKHTPQNTKINYKRHKTRLAAITLTCFAFFLFGGWAINHYYLPQLLHPISLLGNVVILSFTIFLQWTLIQSKKKMILFTGTTIFILFIFSLNVSSSITHKYIDTSSTEALKSLPYLDLAPIDKNSENSGVTKYNQKLAFNGINIVCIKHLRSAYLMDMSGNTIHKWSTNDAWMTVKMCKNGDLLASVYEETLTRIDWDSNIKWKKKIYPHHDIALAENEDIYVLTRNDEIVFSYGLPLPIHNDHILILSPDGTVKRRVNFFKVLKKEITFEKVIEIYQAIFTPQTIWSYTIINPPNIHKELRKKIPIKLPNDSPFDIFHNNTITIIDRNIDGLCKKQDILISPRQLDLIGIMDMETEQLIWSWGPGQLSRQHQPTLLKNGNILIFDNGCAKKQSRVIELDPITKKIVWEYKANPPEQFYSPVRGGCQRLPNGNTLITDDSKGHVFEVTKNGKIVWEFYTPIRNMQRALIYRMMRITDPQNYPKLKNLK